MQDVEADLDARAAKAIADMNALDGDDDASDNVAVPTDDVDGDAEPVEAKEEPKPKAKAKAEPEETEEDDSALAKIAELERKNYAVKAKRMQEREERQLQEQLQKIQSYEASLKEREERLAQAEKTWDDPASVLDMLSEKVGADNLTKWILAQSNPDEAAKMRARAEAKKVEESSKAALTKLEREIEALKQEREQERIAYAKAQAEQKFVDYVSEYDSPLIKTWLKNPKKKARLLTAAHNIADSTPGATFDDIALALHEELSFMLSDEAAEEAAKSESPKSNGHSLSPSKGKTLTNRLSSERSVVVDAEEQWASLPLNERARIVERRAKRGEL